MINNELKKFPPGATGKIDIEFRYFTENNRTYSLIFYFESNEWVTRRDLLNILSKRNLTIKDWYDYHYLDRDEDNNLIYPKCKYCNSLAEWNNRKIKYKPHCKDHFLEYRSEYNSKASKIQKIKCGSDNTSLSSFKSRYGEDKGYRKWCEWRDKLSKSRTLDGMIELYGEESGKDRYNKLLRSMSYCRTLQGRIDKYGEEKGLEIHSRISNNMSLIRSSAESCISLKGSDESFIKTYKASINNLSSVSSHSNISKELFDSIIDRIGPFINDIPDDIYYGSHEWKMPNTKKWGDIKRMRIPDFFIKSKRIIIEFQGDYWHPRPNSPEFQLKDFIENSRVEDNVLNDYYKLVSYRNQDYYVFYVHENEYRMTPELILEDCIKFITNESFRIEYTKNLDMILNLGVS